ncbi:MAG TPA: L,D-transpeptidase [Chthoniobacterales bacterium]|nr:L,D-transpeptidase [Chthoniobacterales bacterium]
MQHLSRLFLLCIGATAALFLTSCGTMTTASSSGSYRVIAHKPQDPSKVEVKLSLSTQNLYVVEGDRLLMAVQGNVGKPGAATPTGNFTIYSKEKKRRRQSEPDRGYPMAYWCEFKPAYGFHEGFVHPAPHTHGCVRLHREAAARLFALTRIGTPVTIQHSLPEDKKWGSQVRRLDQSKDPDPPRSVMMSDSWFQDPPGPLLVD